MLLDTALLPAGLTRLSSIREITNIFPVSSKKEIFYNGSSHPAPRGMLLAKCREADPNLLDKFSGSFADAVKDQKAIVTSYPTPVGYHSVVVIGMNEFEIGMKNTYSSDCIRDTGCTVLRQLMLI